MVLYGFKWFCMVLYGFVWFCMVWYGLVWFDIVVKVKYIREQIDKLLLSFSRLDQGLLIGCANGDL